MNVNVYDIESLLTVFTVCNYDPQHDHVDVYYLADSPLTAVLEQQTGPRLLQLCTDIIHEKNPTFSGTVSIHDLTQFDANVKLSKTFGVSDAYMANDKSSPSKYPAEFRLVCDTDAEYDPDTMPYYIGYNSQSYDTTMLAMYFHEVWDLRHKPVTFTSTTAKLIRQYNNELFSDAFKKSMPQRLLVHPEKHGWSQKDYTDSRWRIRQNMLLSGRHLDISRMNEKMAHVALKRLLGMMGGQILESDKLRPGQDSISTLEEFLDLVAYNVSDCVNLYVYLYKHPYYQGRIDVKAQMLEDYPELIYKKKDNKYEADVRPDNVRRDRMTLDSTSATLTALTLAPYSKLSDIPAVSFVYPTEAQAKKFGIRRRNILEECKEFYYGLFPQPEIRAEFNRIYNFYKRIEGSNFNDSEKYQEDYGNTPDYKPAENLAQFEKTALHLIYYYSDGSPSSCFAMFSTGGIHGAEYNKRLYDYDMARWQAKKNLFDLVQNLYPNPEDCKAARTITYDDTTYPASYFLATKKKDQPLQYKNIDAAKPELFVTTDKGATKLNAKYAYTSADVANHEDFKSYYPNLLRMMEAFYNKDLGYDRYGEIFEQKELFGKQMKDKSRPEYERAVLKTKREGTKLSLNSASGKADGSDQSPIRMNNQIISMRIIGQLFSFMIGQAQTYKGGARIISTNTDGLYSVLDEELNNKLLASEAKTIGVDIEPEPLILISKDTNNRMECEQHGSELKVTAANGGSLCCRNGPTPTQALSHPAIRDWAISEYLICAACNYKNAGMDKPFVDELGASILNSARNKFDRVKWLIMFQNVLASSDGSQTYVYAFAPDDPSNITILQHYNRIFLVKQGTPGAVHLQNAAVRVITDATVKKRQRDNEKLQQHDPVALNILKAYGITAGDIPINKEATITKITGLDPEWDVIIQNKDLHYLSEEEMQFLENSIDMNKYLELLRTEFTNSWKNTTPEELIEKEQEEARIKAEKERAKAEEKARIKAEKDAERARLRAEREAEKARLKAEKEAEKTRLKEEKARLKRAQKEQQLSRLNLPSQTIPLPPDPNNPQKE